MTDENLRQEIARKVLLHLYNSAVPGTLRSISMALQIARSSRSAKHDSTDDLHALSELASADARVFYSSAAAIAEFAVYCVLDFIETYNRFDCPDNESPFPHLGLTYEMTDDESEQMTLSAFGSGKLGQLFKQLARSSEFRSLRDQTVSELTTP